MHILDVNDNVPFFTSSIYEASVTEGADIGTFVLQVSATDLDLGQNGEVSKELSPRLCNNRTSFVFLLGIKKAVNGQDFQKSLIILGTPDFYMPSVRRLKGT